MTDKKKSRLSMLDSLAAAGAGAPPPSMMSSNRALALGPRCGGFPSRLGA